MCNYLYNEFLAIEKMLSLYAEYANFTELLQREYEIGTLFAKGHRDPEYWALRFIPWLKGANRSSEVFSKALKRAPFAPEAAAARLHLAYLYDQEDNISKSIAQLRILIKDYPNTKEYRYALLALAESLFELAKAGDGDGSLAKEAYDALLKFQKLYPNDTENHWVNKMITYYKDNQAKRLMDMAKFYERSGKKDAAARYLAQILKEYPNSLSSDDAEKKLSNLDKTYLVTSFNDTTKKRRTSDYRVYQIPKEAKDVLIYPSNDNNYLLPIYDLKINKTDNRSSIKNSSTKVINKKLNQVKKEEKK
jgi:outer membrane protein assembly factor BamD (BamD/ComL family)